MRIAITTSEQPQGEPKTGEDHITFIGAVIVRRDGVRDLVNLQATVMFDGDTRIKIHAFGSDTRVDIMLDTPELVTHWQGVGEAVLESDPDSRYPQGGVESSPPRGSGGMGRRAGSGSAPAPSRGRHGR